MIITASVTKICVVTVSGLGNIPTDKHVFMLTLHVKLYRCTINIDNIG